MGDIRIIVRKLIAAVMVLGMFMTNAIVIHANADTKSLSPKKVVSILYDDSASMHISSNPSWAYANYAIQTFTGLMNDNDTLLLTYMSEPDKVIKSSDNGGILKDFSKDRQSTVNNMRENTDGGSITPFSAVDTAYRALKSEKDIDESTQYWLVIITDGAFEKEPGNVNTEASKDEIQEKLNSCVASSMPNGSTVKIVYMAIGDEAVIPEENRNITVKKSNASDIVDTMSAIADEISGRYRLEENDLKITDGNTLEISSNVPLLNIQVLTQETDVSVEKAELKDGGELSVKTIGVSSPEQVEGRNLGEKLYGNISTITSGGDYIDEGDYTIQLSSNIKKEDIVVLYEVALETRMTITRDGKQVKDTSVLRQNDVIDISCDVVKIGTDETIDLSLLPDNMYQGFSLTIDEEGTRVAETDKFEYENYKVSTKETEITATANLTGFAPLIKKEDFLPKKPVVYGIQADKKAPELPKNGLTGKEGSVDFLVTGDGEPLSRAEIESIIDEGAICIQHQGEETVVKPEYQVLENGILRVFPKAPRLHRWVLGYLTIPSGEYSVTASIDEKTTATGAFRVNQYTIGHIIISLILLTLLIWLIGWGIKKKFPRASVTKMVFDVGYNEVRGEITHTSRILTGRIAELSPFTQFFKTYKASRKKIPKTDLTLIAGKRGNVYIDQKWCERHRNHYIFGDIPMERNQKEMENAAAEAFRMIKNDSAADYIKGKNVKFDRQRILYVVTNNAANVITAYQIRRKK